MLRASLRLFSNQTQTKNGPPILFLALGNPSSQFNETRHNVGKWALEKMIHQVWLDFNALKPMKQYGPVLLSTSTKPEHSNVLMAKTTGTYMNLSGPVVHKAWMKFKQQHSGETPCLVIIHDELQVPLGKIQIRRRNTSARGHNGLRSIDKQMGNDYMKLAIGIGKAPGANVADYVLSNFKSDERQILEKLTMPLLMDIMNDMVMGKHVFDRV